VRIGECEDMVRSFISNAYVTNRNTIFDIYPLFTDIQPYNKIGDIVIETSSISSDKSVTIICHESGRDEKKLLFELEYRNGKYIISQSKGLSIYCDSRLFSYCKRIGCLDDGAYDIQVSSVCADKQGEYERLVQKIKNEIESGFEIESHTLEVRSMYGFSKYVSGSISMKNNSRFSIPSRVYDIYIVYMDSNHNVILRKKILFDNYESILYGGIKTSSIYSETNVGSASRVNVELKLTSTDFIEDIIANYVEGENCFQTNL
jgi:hypothetical protein